MKATDDIKSGWNSNVDLKQIIATNAARNRESAKCGGVFFMFFTWNFLWSGELDKTEACLLGI